MIEMKQGKISLKNGFDKFIVHCKVKNLSDMTIRYYKDEYGFFTTYLENKDIYLENINKKMIDNYVLYMRSQGLRDTTINTRIRSIRAILYFLMEEGDLGYFKIKLIVQTQENKKLYTDKEIENNIISKYNKQRGVEKTGVHLFRHYYAKNYIQNSGDCLKLQKLLGHTTLEMTKIYVELYGNDLQKDYNKFNTLDVLIGNTEKIKMRGN